MEYRQLGNSALSVSEIALGSWLTYSGGVPREQAIACIRRALDLGVTLLDTANVYGRGAAESLLGEALADIPRDDYVLATKVYFPMSETDRGLSRPQIEKQLDASLKRLGVDHVDLYQCHRYDDETPLEETMAALTDAVRAGKTRYIGFSEWPVEKIREATEMAGVEHFVSSQPRYSMIWRQPEAEVIPYCADHGISQIVWSPLGQGILTGKYRPGAPPPPESRAASSSMGGSLQDLAEREALLEAVQRMQALAGTAGLSLAQFALAWVLRERNVASAIIGASRPEQVEENVKAAGARVDPVLFEEAEALLAPALREAAA